MMERPVSTGPEAIAAIRERLRAVNMSNYEAAQRANREQAITFSHAMRMLGSAGAKDPHFTTVTSLAQSVGLEIVIREAK